MYLLPTLDYKNWVYYLRNKPIKSTLNDEEPDFIDTYHDSKISETAPTLVKMEFSESEVTITFEESEYDDEGTKTLSWEIFDGMLKIPESNGEIANRDLIFSRSISDQNITVLLDTKPGIAPLLMIKDQNLAQSIYDKWIKATD